MTEEYITVGTREQFRKAIMAYGAKGFQTILDEGAVVTLSRKKKFNWLVAIICLFIPIIGWIALVAMIIAAGRGSEVVQIELQDEQAQLNLPRYGRAS